MGDGQSLLWDPAAPGRPGPGFLPVRRQRVCSGAEAQAWLGEAAEGFADPVPLFCFFSVALPCFRLS